MKASLVRSAVNTGVDREAGRTQRIRPRMWNSMDLAEHKLQRTETNVANNAKSAPWTPNPLAIRERPLYISLT